jgi:succinyl-CoA synthetase beta subunit
MLIHEFQAKGFLRHLGIEVPDGRLAETPEQVKAAALDLSCPVMLKAQILAGGRGKAGGIILARTEEEAEEKARSLLGRKMVTAQTGPPGLTVRKILVEKTLNIKKEFYLGLTVDRNNEVLTAIVSQQGGISIEQLSHSHPELLKKVVFEPWCGLLPFQARQLAYFLIPEEDLVNQLINWLKRLSQFLVDKDLKLLEINPLVLTEENKLIAADARIEFDDCGLSRHPEIAALEDLSDRSPLENEARRHQLNYLKMDGQVGCLVNGAGLAMATMDLIQYFGGRPANFLDIGGGVTEEAVSRAFEILIEDDRVRSALVNIFGGIVRCDLVARGIVASARKISLSKPVVVRLEGTNVELGRKILQESGLPFHFVDDFEQAARLAVSLCQPEISS